MAASKKEIQVFCVRADGGYFTDHFIKGDFIGIGWLPENDLSAVKSKEELEILYRKEYSDDTSNNLISQQVGQISRFLFDIEPGDYVITPSKNNEYLYWGEVTKGEYYYSNTNDGCRYTHRKKVKWSKNPIQRSLFSIPFQYTLRAALTVFNIEHKKDFFTIIGKPDMIGKREIIEEDDYYKLILNRLLELSFENFEQLIKELLSAMGFETQVTRPVKDDGIDVEGTLDVDNLVKINLIVQVKRYKLNTRITEKVVKDLRGRIPHNGQGAFITTADFQKKAYDTSIEDGFPRIGLINGEKLVDLLVENWDKLPASFRQALNLKIGLVPN